MFHKIPLFSEFRHIKWQPVFKELLVTGYIYLITSFPDCHNLFESFILVQGACCYDKLETLHFTYLSLASSSMRQPASKSLHAASFKPQLWAEALIFSKTLTVLLLQHTYIHTKACKRIFTANY